jgi:hypothetical protein
VQARRRLWQALAGNLGDLSSTPADVFVAQI